MICQNIISIKEKSGKLEATEKVQNLINEGLLDEIEKTLVVIFMYNRSNNF